jgi:hypothetical protein
MQLNKVIGYMCGYLDIGALRHDSDDEKRNELNGKLIHKPYDNLG